MGTFLLLLLLNVPVSAGAQAGPKPSHQGPHVRRVCYEHLPIHLGDSFESVSKLVELRPDTNGSSRNPRSVPGRGVEYIWTGGKGYALPDGGELRPTVVLSFAGARALRSVTINWRFDGDLTAASRAAVAELLRTRVHPCLGEQFEQVDETTYRGRVDYGTYSETLKFEARPDAGWHIEYVIREEP
jgi:hypothetical protein